MIIRYLTIFIACGFIYKSIYGSNNEIQIARVFWHDARPIHALLWACAAIALIYENVPYAILCLLIDVIFSIVYRLYTNK